MIGEQVAQDMLRVALDRGGYLSLHSGDPGGSGNGQIGQWQQFRAGTFSYQGRQATNGLVITGGTASQGGNATWYGLWTLGGNWINGGQLRTPLRVQQGFVVTVERGEITVRLA